MSITEERNRRYFIITKIILLFMYLGTFTAYFVVIITQSKGTNQNMVGLIHVCLLLVSDQVIYWLDNERNYFIVTDTFKCIFQFITRFLCCFLLDYWLSMESISFFLTLSIVGINFFEKIMPREGNTAVNEFHQICYENPLFKGMVESHIKEITCPEGPPIGYQKTAKTKLQIFEYYFSEIIFFIHICLFSAFAAMERNNVKGMDAKEFYLLNNLFYEWIIALFALMFGTICALFYGWFRYYQYIKFQQTWVIYATIGFIEGISISMGFVFFKLLQVKQHLIWTSFAILPVIIGTFLFFLGNWISNDYFFYSSQPVTQDLGKITDQVIIDTQKAEEQKKQESRLKEITKETFFTEFKKIICCGYLPLNKCTKDKMNFFAVISNMALLILYSLVTAYYFDPWYVGFTIGMWIAIIQLTIIIFIKYYQSYYQMSFTVQFSVILAFVIFTIWITIMGIFAFVKLKGEERTKVLVSFCVGSCGYLLSVILGMAWMKTNAIQKGASLSISIKLLFTTAFLIVAAVGAVIIALTSKGDVWGHVICGVAGYLIVVLWWETRRMLISIVFAFLLLGYAIFAIIFYRDQSQTVLQGLSMILILIFLFFAFNFIRSYLDNREKEQSQIFIYTKTLFPTMKYISSENKLVSSNKELIYFILTVLTFFIWSFLAGILLKLHDRFIGISFSAITISVVYLYISERIKSAIFLVTDRFQIANLQFYIECISQAIKIKRQWRIDYMGQKLLKGGSASASETVLSQIDVEREINFIKQWTIMYEIESADLLDKYSRIMFFSFMGQNRANTQLPEISDDRLTENEEFFMEAETADLQIDFLLKTQEIMQAELLFDVQFYAFLNGYMNLRMSKVEEKIKQAIDKWNVTGAKDGSTKVGPQIPETDEQKKARELAEKKRAEEEAQRITAENIKRLEEEHQREMDEFIMQQERNREEDEKQEELDRLMKEKMLFEKEQLRQKEEQERVLKQQEAQRVKEQLEKQKQLQLLEEQRKKNELEEQLKKIQLETAEKERKKKEEQMRQEEINRKRKIAQAEEEAKIKKQQQIGGEEIQKVELNQIVVKEMAQDEQKLLEEGNKIRQKYLASNFQDPDFDVSKALDDNPEADEYEWERVKDLDNDQAQQKQIKVFDDGTNACDIRQGALGDCYLLSSMSVIAHTRPDLLQKIFHPESRKYQENGLYTVMFFRNRKPVIITVDDYFPGVNSQHAYVKIGNSNPAVKEIWPMIIEKAYAKMYGSYLSIESGLIQEAMVDLTNGTGVSYSFEDEECKKMIESGDFWQKLVFWNKCNYLIGAGSPAGSDANVSEMGIVQGHAYSVLDVYEVEGNKLIQLRNPWGDETEWLGAWGDKSKEWTERRRRMVYDRMQQRGVQQTDIGKNDGVFWMSLTDFFSNFSQINLCRLFGQEYVEISYNSEWSVAKKTAGGCMNTPSYAQNPQMKLFVESPGPIDIFIQLNIVVAENDRSAEATIGIGFSVFDLKGQKAIDNRVSKSLIFENTGGFIQTNSINYDGKIKPYPTKGVPYTFIMSAFNKGDQAKFNVVMWYKKSQGSVRLEEF